MISSFFISQMLFGSEVSNNNVHIIETAMVIHLICYLLYGEPGYGGFETTGPFRVGFKEFTTKEM